MIETPPVTRIAVITSMQNNVLSSLRQGKSTEGIARDWGISRNTVKTHVRLLLKRTRARDRVELVALVASGQLRVVVLETTRRIELCA